MSLACTQFVAGGGQKGNRCMTCWQKQRHHPIPSGNPHHATDPRPAQRHAASCPPPSEKTLVQDILNKYTHSCSQPRTTTPQLELICHEAIAGLRKMPPHAAKFKALTRGFPPVNTTTHSTASSSRTECAVKIGILFMTLYGLGADGELADSRKLGKAKLEELYIDLWLRHLLPKPFQWLDAHLGRPDEDSFHWVLLSSERKRYFHLRHTTITGKELDEVKGTTGRKFTSFSMIIAPHIVIPKHIYSNWDRAVARALSSSADHDAVSEDEADIDLNEADVSSKATHPARPPGNSESDESDIQVIETTSPQAFGVLAGATNNEVAPSQSTKSTVPRATAHTPVVLPDPGSDDEFFFHKSYCT
ncbi:hypothetical protein JVU11DRAFT_9822 [Chiua virens]|nr:hypothetical protein JVU11DRAFT_9822 [Chiua virens]